jgi:holin-like protein
MKYTGQLVIILFFTFAGEAARYFLPLPIPANIYGLIFLLLALIFKIVRLEQVKEMGRLLVDMMPLLFVPATVGLMGSVGAFEGILIRAIVLVLATTVMVMAVSGFVAQWIIRRGEGGGR